MQCYPLFQRLVGPDGIVGNEDDPVITLLTTYTFTLGIGQRLPGNQYGGVYGGYSFELVAGMGGQATVIAQQIDAVTPPPGMFVTRTITVDTATATLSPTLYGQPLTIRMASTASGANAESDFDNVRLDAVISELLPGDVNLNRHVSTADISAMLAALIDVKEYQSSHGLTDAQLLAIADVNKSGTVNNADIQALLNLLRSGGGSGSGDSATAVPEPASVVTLCMGMLTIVSLRRMTMSKSCTFCRTDKGSTVLGRLAARSPTFLRDPQVCY